MKLGYIYAIMLYVATILGAVISAHWHDKWMIAYTIFFFILASTSALITRSGKSQFLNEIINNKD